MPFIPQAIVSTGLQGKELDYAAKTTQSDVTATAEDGTANIIVTNNSVTFDGSTTVWIHLFAPVFSGTDATFDCTICLYEDGTSVGQVGQVTNSATGAFTHGNVPVNCWTRITPSAGAHTYSWRGFNTAGSKTMSFYAGVGGVGVRRAMFSAITRVS